MQKNLAYASKFFNFVFLSFALLFSLAKVMFLSVMTTELYVCVSKVVSKYFFKKKKQKPCIADNQFGPVSKGH